MVAVGTFENDLSRLAHRRVSRLAAVTISDSADTLGVVERRELIGSLEATAAMVAVGSSVAAATALVTYPIAGGQALRYGLAGALLVAVAWGRLPRLTRRQAARLLALAASGLAGFNAFLIAAVREADAGSVGVIVGCVPVALALAGPLLEGRAVRPGVVAAAIVVSAGAAAVQGAGGSMSLAGLLLSLGALACEAAFSLLAVPLIASLGARSVSAYACLFAVPLLFAVGLGLDGRDALPLPSLEETGALAYMAVVVTALAFVLWYSGVERLGVERAGLFAGIVPISALLSATALGASSLTLIRLLGAAAVGLGVTVGVRSDGFRSASGRTSNAASSPSSPSSAPNTRDRDLQ
jgi:drug/metabolite transporter (DMT)-like permease